MADKIVVTELNEILLNSMSNRWSKQEGFQGFGCKYILFLKAVNMFERIEIVESIYEGVVTPSYKKITRAEANRTGISIKKIGEAASSNSHPATDGSTGKHRKRCVD